MNDRRSASPFLPAALRVFDLGLGEMLWSRRSVFMAFVAGGPVLIAVLLRAIVSLTNLDVSAASINATPVTLSGPDLFGLMIWTFYLRFTVPVLGVFYGTALIADEVEDRTITYLFTRPVSRGAVLAGKYLAYLVCTAVVVLPSVVLVYFLVVPLLGGSIGRNFPALVVDLGLIGVGLAVYGAVFAYVGARFRRPLLTGLIFVFGWEPVVVVVPGYMKHLSVAYYLQGLAPHAMPQGDTLNLIQAMLTSIQTPLATWVSLLALGVIWTAALAASIRVVERREYVLAQ